MTKSKIVLHSLIHAVGVLAYIIGVMFVMAQVAEHMPQQDGFLGAIPFLLMLVFSVAVMAVLVFGRPVYLFLSGAKKEAIQFLGFTMGWIFVFLVIAIAIAFTGFYQ